VVGRDVRRMIRELDPVENDAEIAHLSMEVLTPPSLAHLGYASGAARTVASPRVAERATRQGQGDQLRRPVTRNVDTLTFFGELMRLGHRSAEGRAACERISQIHRNVGRIRNDDQIFVLSQLIWGHERIGAALGLDPFSEHQRQALTNFWLGVGHAMGLRNLPTTRAELEDWVTAYEQEWFEPTDMAHDAAEGYLTGFARTIPKPLRGLARSAFVAMMDEPMRTCLGYEQTKPLVMAAWRTQWRTAAVTTLVRPVRLDSTWVKSFSRIGPDPDLNRIGYGSPDTGGMTVR